MPLQSFGPSPAPVATAPAAAPALCVLYGSQTGNGEALATALADAARAQGFQVILSNLADYKPSKLKRESLLSLVISTHGEGDPPDDAELFYEFLMSAKAPRLAALKYSVLALGDSSYIRFCETGREIDQRLAGLGATRLESVVECDLDYESTAAAWTKSVLAKLPDLLEAGAAVPVLRAVKSAPRFDKHNPYPAEILVNQKITGKASSKDVRHLELSLEGSGLDYLPGDSLAAIVENPPQLIAGLLEELHLDAATTVSWQGEDRQLGDVLLRDVEITALNLAFLRRWQALGGSQELAGLLDGQQQAALAALIETHQVIDIVRRFPAQAGADELLASLRKLSPRSYSIASSQAANPDEVHLTIAAVRYAAHGSEHWGAASTYLADRLAEGQTISIYMEPNTRFRLPQDDAAPVIMIGPGTGVAPFRAFVEERAERNAAGRNWLFFGDRTFADDFLYQREWLGHLRNGRLDRLDVAFSRDKASKVYVQDRLHARAAELYAWIQDGAYLYVCGDAKNMAGDVHEALIDIIAAEAGVTRDAANTQLKDLRKAGRYQRDVY